VSTNSDPLLTVRGSHMLSQKTSQYTYEFTSLFLYFFLSKERDFIYIKNKEYTCFQISKCLSKDKAKKQTWGMI
jgi:hypothetical protein